MLVDQKFDLIEATIADVHAAFRRGELTARELVELYLARIEAYDQKAPAINSLISINPRALDGASALDAAFKRDGRLVGPLHGIGSDQRQRHEDHPGVSPVSRL
jgi:amidase